MNGQFSETLPKLVHTPLGNVRAWRGSGVVLLRAAGRALRAGFERLLLWQERASQRHHLMMMGDHMLSDIGLSRADVDAEARKPFWQH